MAYIKLTDSEHGEIGHNGWTYVLDNPFDADDRAHPAYYEEAGILSVRHGTTVEDDDCNPRVVFRPMLGTTRGGVAPRPEIVVSLTVAQARSAKANRAAYDAIHAPPGGWRVITD